MHQSNTLYCSIKIYIYYFIINYYYYIKILYNNHLREFLCIVFNIICIRMRSVYYWICRNLKDYVQYVYHLLQIDQYGFTYECT